MYDKISPTASAGAAVVAATEESTPAESPTATWKPPAACKRTFADLLRLAHTPGCFKIFSRREADPETVEPHESQLPEVCLPGGDVTITISAERLGSLLGATGECFCRGGVPTKMSRDDQGQPRLWPIKAAALCSDLEAVAKLVKTKEKDGGETTVSTTCTESTAKLLLEAGSFRSALPPINLLSRCPVLVERDGQLVAVSGYDRASGILTGGSPAESVELSESIRCLWGLMNEFRFATDGDRARALAALVTPALVFGGLLKGRAPIDLGEADASQSGKGFRNKLTTAVYNSVPRIITQRAASGVGSVQEIFDSALIAGACFIPFDNFRGRLDFPGLESFLTEDTYSARVPYTPTVVVDPRRVVVMFTSNAAEVTTDLANRCSCVRILKQPAGYEFKRYHEGDLLSHVSANQPRYLGAVFTVIREWYRRGQPQSETSGHDFRQWAGVLGYISKNIFKAGELLAGHRQVQERIASPGLTWLRDLAMAVQKDGRARIPLRAHELLEIADKAGIQETPDDHDAWVKACGSLGRKLGKVFIGREEVIVDSFTITRTTGSDENSRQRPQYTFSLDSLMIPDGPRCAPDENAGFPDVPDDFCNYPHAHMRMRTHAHTRGKTSGSTGGIGGPVIHQGNGFLPSTEPAGVDEEQEGSDGDIGRPARERFDL